MSGRRLAWFHCYAGIAGDMALGALLDAGADLDEVLALVRRIPVGGWRVEPEPVLRCGLAATRAGVHAPEDGVVRTAANIVGLLDEAQLPQRVHRRARATFEALAKVEGELHRRPPGQVHFHEVGGLDAIVDVVGVCAALEVLGVDEVHSSPVATGLGMVRASHGLLPNPAPAVVALLKDRPTYGRDVAVELTTPTGAALLAALAEGWGPLPAMTVESVGYGAGARELDGMPNTTQVVLGGAARVGRPAQSVVVLETNVDDATGETLAHAVAALLDAGAHDAWITPIVMKKGRPAYTVSALADPSLAAQVGGVLARETGSLGVRGSSLERWTSTRALESVDLDGRAVRVKVSPGRVKAEFDDVAAVARDTGTPLRDVTRAAEDAWRARHPSVGPVPDGDAG